MYVFNFILLNTFSNIYATCTWMLELCKAYYAVSIFGQIKPSFVI